MADYWPKMLRISLAVVPCVNPFFKTVVLNRLSVSGLIDSGCSNVLVRETTTIKCQAEIGPKPRPLFTVPR